MAVLALMDLAAIYAYRKRIPSILVCSYLIEGPTYIALIVFSVLFFFKIAKHGEEKVFFIGMGVSELLLLAVGYVTMHQFLHRWQLKENTY